MLFNSRTLFIAKYIDISFFMKRIVQIDFINFVAKFTMIHVLATSSIALPLNILHSKPG